MDSEARILDCVKAAVTDLRLPLPPDEAISDIIGLGLREAIDRLFPGADEELYQGIVDGYRRHFLEGSRVPSRLFAGSREVIETLAARQYLLAVATGKGRMGLDAVLESTETAALFHATRCADEAFSKPHPAMLEQLLEELGVSPGEALMIGDTEYDMQMAANAGVAALAVSYGVHPPERLLRHAPLGCLNDIRELPGWLDQALNVSQNEAV